MSVTEYVDKRWELNGDKHEDVNVIDVEKKRFAYRIFREEFEKYKKLEDGKKSEIKDHLTEIYQLIGLDNVFQGVWFQGVTELAAQQGCRFSAIPITLSVLMSLVTIVGVLFKISQVRKLENSLRKDRLHSKVLQSLISACEYHGVNFDFVAIEAAAARSSLWMRIEFDKASSVSQKQRVLLLVTLTVASILFAWLIHVIMCGEYV